MWIPMALLLRRRRSHTGQARRKRKITTEAAAHALYPTAENEDGRCARWLGKDVLRDVIIGFIGGAADSPALSGVSPDQRSAETRTLSFAGVNRMRRHELVWIMGTRLGRKQGSSEESANVTGG